MSENTTLFQDEIEAILKEKVIRDNTNFTIDSAGATSESSWVDMSVALLKSLGWDYGQLEPYVSGNYAVFMQHGLWFQWLKENKAKFKNLTSDITRYISDLDNDKIGDSIFSENHLLFGDAGKDKKFLTPIRLSRQISDISLPEPNKEYIPISTRQKNSFVNTRNYAGSDFTMNWIENSSLDIIRYHEAWDKMITLIRDGKVYIPDKLAGASNYLIPNPYANNVYVAIFEPHTVKLKALITLFGVMPVNMPFKTLIGDRSSPKIANYSMNYKFMDLQYAFYDDWENLNTSAANTSIADGTGSNIAKLFKNFLNINVDAGSM